MRRRQRSSRRRPNSWRARLGMGSSHGFLTLDPVRDARCTYYFWAHWTNLAQVGATTYESDKVIGPPSPRGNHVIQNLVIRIACTFSARAFSLTLFDSLWGLRVTPLTTSLVSRVALAASLLSLFACKATAHCHLQHIVTSHTCRSTRYDAGDGFGGPFRAAVPRSAVPERGAADISVDSARLILDAARARWKITLGVS